MPSDPRIVLDCRWLNSGGAGRLTELILRGLARTPAEAGWILWGPESVAELAWPGARLVVETGDPRAAYGQRHWFRVPDCDLVLFMHQQRPLRRGPSVTYIHDTIPLHFTPNPVARRLKRQYLRAAARLSRQVLTPSEYSRRCVLDDLAIPPGRVTRICPPADRTMAERVSALRRSASAEPFALYLGLFLPHKNLDRLIEAFGRTSFRAGGGRLVIMGGRPAEHAALTARLSPGQREYCEIRPFAGQDELEAALAACRFLVQPSLEEGFGLPAWEALSCGIPLCCSDGGSLPEITGEWADPFPAASTEAMTAALDSSAVRAAAAGPEQRDRASARFLQTAPTLESHAAELVGVLDRALPGRPGTRPVD
ncbi:MAG TPA: glycosyltransferase family 1 protein [Actinomycetota bacterium]|nr:glycosyltransferase family 1 protein [Actinomycetota bacterium]